MGVSSISLHIRDSSFFVIKNYAIFLDHLSLDLSHFGSQVFRYSSVYPPIIFHFHHSCKLTHTAKAFSCSFGFSLRVTRHDIPSIYFAVEPLGLWYMCPLLLNFFLCICHYLTSYSFAVYSIPNYGISGTVLASPPVVAAMYAHIVCIAVDVLP